MHWLGLLILVLGHGGSDDRAPDVDRPPFERLERDEAGVVRLMLPGSDIRIPVARGGNAEGFFRFESHGWHWLFLADPDRIVAGRSKRIEGPYLDHKDRTLLDGGGTLVIGGLPTDPNRKLLSLATGENADALKASDGVRPLVWPPDGYPVAGAAGTLASWRGTFDLAWPFPGPWIHRVDAGPLSLLSVLPGGRINAQTVGTSWTIDGDLLTLSWPRRDAPGGVWVDRCRISRDGRHYLGRNQWQAAVSGELVPAEHSASSHTRILPVALLPKEAIAPEGKLSLWVAFDAAEGESVPVYVVNRTPAAVSFPAENGDIFLKLFGKTPDGVWRRAQGHLSPPGPARRGWRPLLPPDRFFVVLGWFPAEGEEVPVRYRIESAVEAESNVGTGHVRPRTIEMCRTDRLALGRADFETVSEVALGEVRPIAKDRGSLRVYAVEQLIRFRKDERTMRVLRHLLSDPDPRVQEVAAKVVKLLE